MKRDKNFGCGIQTQAKCSNTQDHRASVACDTSDLEENPVFHFQHIRAVVI